MAFNKGDWAASYGKEPARERRATQEESRLPWGDVGNVSYEPIRDEASLKSFIASTYQYFAASLLAGAAGAYAGMQAVATIQSFYWGLVILELGLIFGLSFARHKSYAAPMLFAFTFVTGLTLTPLLAGILKMPGGAGIVTNAFLMTSVAFGGLSLFAMSTNRDFSSMGKMLLIALIVLIVGGIVNIFMQSPLLQVAIAAVGAILFSMFILYDTQNIVRGMYDSPISAAVALYLDFFNLFVSLLQLLGIFGSSDE
ncbi:MAG: Bax inhibitor-1/YccA family protein [Campylobacterales bacterium]